MLTLTNTIIVKQFDNQNAENVLPENGPTPSPCKSYKSFKSFMSNNNGRSSPDIRRKTKFPYLDDLKIYGMNITEEITEKLAANLMTYMFSDFKSALNESLNTVIILRY